MKLTKQRIAEMRSTKEVLEQSIIETAMERTKFEQKIQRTKHESIKEGAMLESDLKSELE